MDISEIVIKPMLAVYATKHYQIQLFAYHSHLSNIEKHF